MNLHVVMSTISTYSCPWIQTSLTCAPAPATSKWFPLGNYSEIFSLCRLNGGLGEEDLDEPPDCLYGLQVRGPPFSLKGFALLGVVGGFGLGGRPCCSSVSPCQVSITFPMEEENKTSHQYPAKDGETISGDCVRGLPSTRDHECSAT